MYKNLLRQVTLFSILLCSMNLSSYAQANDECSTAISLTPTLTCSAVPGSITTATSSAQTLSSCVYGVDNGDIWYSFVATATRHDITLSDVSMTGAIMTYVALSMYSGSCGSLSEEDCDEALFFDGDGESMTLSMPGLTLMVGETYYIRIHREEAYDEDYNETMATSINFNICVKIPADPPANDECVNAVDISDGSLVSGTTDGATESIPTDGCGFGYANDAWHTITTAEAGDLTIDVTTTSTDVIVAVLEGDCGSAVEVDCTDNFYTGTESVTIPGTTAGTTYYIRVYGYSGEEGLFDIQASGTPLPVTATAMKGQVNQQGLAELNWQTFSETNNKGFNIERSEDGKLFDNIAFVPSKGEAGNSTASLTYTFVDKQPLSGAAYYRFVQKDLDGRATQSNIVRLEAGNGKQFITAQPNPATSSIHVRVKGQMHSNATVTIHDMLGKTLVHMSLEDNATVMDISQLPAGLYLIKYQDEAQTSVLKFTKQ